MSETDPRESNPNAAGPDGLRGDMGISSERTGPGGGEEPEDRGIQGTGTRGSAAGNTEGTMTTERQHPEEPAEGRRDIDAPGADSTSSQGTTGAASGGASGGAPGGASGEAAGEATGGADGPEMDDTQQRATQGWRDDQPPANDTNDTAEDTHEDTAEDTPGDTGVDRTVGESNTAEVPGQDFDRSKNPGHSHG